MGKKEKRIIVVLIGVVVIALIFAFIYSYRITPLQISSNAKTETGEKEKEGQRTLYIGFPPGFPAEKMAERWEHLVDYLKKELDMPVESVFRSSYHEIRTMLAKGELDVCLTSSFIYILASEETKITPLVRRIKCGSSSYNSIIIVREDSGIGNLEDLKGKRFAFTDRESTTGWLLPMAMMIKQGICDPEDYFSEVIFTTDHRSALYGVYNRRVDGAVITTTLLCSEDPEVKDKLKDLRIIWKSDSVPLGPFSVCDALDKQLAEKIKRAFLRIDKSDDTRPLLEYLEKEQDIEGFEEARDRDYDVIRNAYDVVRKDMK